MDMKIYLEAYRNAQKEYKDLLDKYHQLTGEVASVEERMRNLKETIISLGRLCEPPPDEPGATLGETQGLLSLGLTDAVREVFRGYPEEFLFPREIADLLLQSGYESNKTLVANVYTVCRRLMQSGKLESKEIDGKIAYKYAAFNRLQQRQINEESW